MIAIRRLPWPMPALLTWLLGWTTFVGLRSLLDAPAPAAAAALVATSLLCMAGRTVWRRWLMALGFPVSLVACGAVTRWPAWAWLLPMVAMAGVFPLRTWRDAPFFPTPRGALRGLAGRVALRDAARVLDAGCGVGDGLLELRREYPHAELHGQEWSWPLRWLCALRCRDATVRRADIWQGSWAGFDMVYVFQRPESMDRVAAKATAELPGRAWLASLEFPIKAWTPSQVLTCADGRSLWLYRMPASRRRDGA